MNRHKDKTIGANLENALMISRDLAVEKQLCEKT